MKNTEKIIKDYYLFYLVTQNRVLPKNSIIQDMKSIYAINSELFSFTHLLDFYNKYVKSYHTFGVSVETIIEKLKGE